MTDHFIIPNETIIGKIYFIRNQKVMLDRDLADLYQVKSRRLREQIKRNAERFPENFMFQLSEKEVELMVSQNAIPSIRHLGGFLPYAFTEHGVLQLSNVIKSDRAVQVSINIIEVFVKMREVLLTNSTIILQLEEMRRSIDDHEERMDMMYNYLQQFIQNQELPRKEIGYKSKN